MAVSRSPWCGRVTLTSANTVYSLFTLLSTHATRPIRTMAIPLAAYINIQSDPTNGSAKVGICNTDSTATDLTDCGMILVAGIGNNLGMGNNTLNLKEIGLISDTSSAVVNIILVMR
ncbi:MAG TPA: hypothetical protein VIM84_15930 [Gemmatimonadales bacterium]